MRQHSNVGVTRHLRQPGDRCRDVIGAGDDACHQRIEGVARKPGALDHAAALVRLGQVADRRIHVVVEREQVDASIRQPFDDFGFGVEIVGLVAQMEAGVGRQLRPHRFDRFE
jgi:hypothetical protein